MEVSLSPCRDCSTGEAGDPPPEYYGCSFCCQYSKKLSYPVGLYKMLVDGIGDVTITNDGATILKLLEVGHSATKVHHE